MNRQYYNKNDTITLTIEDRIQEFAILEEVGHGVMSAGYKVNKKTPAGDVARLLFEFCPLYLDRESDAYKYERKRFINTLRLKCELGSQKETVNQTAPFLDMYEDKITGSLWAETTWINGEPLSSLIKKDIPLAEFLNTIQYLLAAVAGYHKKGYLMLSVKPQNVECYVRGFGVDGVRILDFGTMVKKSEIEDPKKRDDSLISFSPKWSAPEVFREDFDSVSEKADIYSIGLIIYCFLFEGNLPFSNSSISRRLGDDLKNCSVLKRNEEKSAIVQILIKELLEGMLANKPNERFDDDQAMEAVEKLIEEVGIKRIHKLNKLGSDLPQTAERFIPGSRDKEEAELLAAVRNGDPFIVVSAPGGTGKSELVCDFIGKHSKEFDFYHLTYDGASIMKTMLKLPLHPKLELKARDDDGNTVTLTDEQLYDQVRSCIRRYGRETVIVIDNLDAPNDDFTCTIQQQTAYKDLIDLPVCVIATSRYEEFEGATKIAISENRGMCRSLLKAYLPKSTIEERKALVDAVNANTLAVDIVGRTLKESMRFGTGVTIQTMLDALQGKADFSGFKPVRAEYRGDRTEKEIVAHLANVFNVSGKGEQAEAILRFTSLFPVNGILMSLANGTFASDDDNNSYRELVKTGWIREKKVGDAEKVYLHPIVGALVKEKMKSGDSKAIVRTYLPAFADVFKLHVASEAKKNSIFARMYKEDLSFAESLADTVLNEIKIGKDVSIDIVDRTADIYANLSQHYYHMSDRADLRKGFLSKAAELLEFSIDRKTGAEKESTELNLARQIFFHGISSYQLDQFALYAADCDKALAILLGLNSLIGSELTQRNKLIEQIYTRKGEGAQGQGKRAEALEFFDRAIEIAQGISKEDLAAGLRFKGIILGDGGSIVEALRLFKLAIDNDDLLMRAYNCVGLYLAEAHLYDAAELNYRKAYNCWNNDEKNRPTYLYINMVNHYSDVGRFKEAEKWCANAFYELFRDSGRETADQVVKLLAPKAVEVFIKADDPHLIGTLSCFVCMCALRMLCRRDGRGINRGNAKRLADCALSSCDDDIRALYYDIVNRKEIDPASVFERASQLKYNLQTAAYLFNRIAEFMLLTGENRKAYALSLASYKLNNIYQYPLGEATSIEMIKKASKLLSLKVSPEITKRGKACIAQLEREKHTILNLKDTEMSWLFN